MDQLCLKWNNYHSSMTSVINQLLSDNVFVDVTLSCENIEIQAHKLILSACSTYFQRVLVNSLPGHPVLIMPPNVKPNDLRAIVEYIYKGEIYVTRDQLSDIVQVANLLKIKSESSDETHPSPQPGTSAGESNFNDGAEQRDLKPLDMSTNGSAPSRRPTLSSRQSSTNSQRDGLGDQEACEEEENTSESGHAFGKESPSSSSPYLDKMSGASTHVGSPSQVGSSGAQAQTEFFNIKMEPMADDGKAKFVDTEDQSNEARPVEVVEARARRKIHDLFDINKRYSKQDLESALDSIRQGIMTISTACSTFGIPAATLWQRANKMGIITTQASTNRLWNEEDMQQALEALRTGRISANRASKEFGVPSSTLYKMAKKEGIKLAMPFGSGPVSYSQENLSFALDAIRNGLSVQKASNQFGIPPGTLYAKCKKEGIELSHKTFPSSKPWTHESMLVALDAVLMGHLSINQASNKYNVPYSSLYSRVKRIQAGEELDMEQDEELFDDDYDEQLTLDVSMNESLGQ